MDKGWKYGLIKVAIEDEGTDYEEQINLLVELYPMGDNGEYDAYCKARIQTVEELQNAQADIERDGINEWFYDNGTFTWGACGACLNGEWDWEPSSAQQKNKRVTLTSLKEASNGETFVELNENILSQMGWCEGDDIEVMPEPSGQITLKKLTPIDNASEKHGTEFDDEYDLYTTYGGD